MKKILIAIALFTIGLTSCKKDYTCDCKDGNGTSFEKTTYPNTSLVDAKRSCDERENVWKNTSQPASNCTIL